MTNLLSKPIPNIIQILWLQKVTRTPFLDPLVVRLMVVQSKQAIHAFPLTLLRCNPGTSLVRGIGDQLVYNA